MTSRGCFENRTFHIYIDHNKNPKCCIGSSDYIQKVKFGAIINHTCKNVTLATNGLSQNVIGRTFGVRYPNYQVRNDAFDISCNKVMV